MLVELDIAGSIRAIARGEAPPADRFYPSEEARRAYEVVRSHLRARGRRFTVPEAREEFARRWPHLPWGEMRYWAMVKTAARLLEDQG